MSKKLSWMASLSALAALSAGGVAVAQTTGGYPADAEPGQCFARVLIPEVSENVAEQVIDQPARTETRLIPATYEMVDEQILVREARTEYTVVPATYRTVTETVTIEPERTEQIVQAASMQTVQERVLVRPAYTTWKPGNNLFGRARGGVGASAGTVVGPDGTEVPTGELLCRVEVPAEYTTVSRQVEARPESMQTRVIPARTQQITREVIATPARVAERAIPAEFRTIKVRRQVTPPRTETIQIPATYRTVNRRVVRSGGGVEWREVLCETNTSPAKIAEIQRALTARGFAVPATGQFGPQTLAAMEAFQRSNGLPVGNLTIDTARALGVNPR